MDSDSENVDPATKQQDPRYSVISSDNVSASTTDDCSQKSTVLSEGTVENTGEDKLEKGISGKMVTKRKAMCFRNKPPPIQKRASLTEISPARLGSPKKIAKIIHPQKINLSEEFESSIRIPDDSSLLSGFGDTSKSNECHYNDQFPFPFQLKCKNKESPSEKSRLTIGNKREKFYPLPKLDRESILGNNETSPNFKRLDNTDKSLKFFPQIAKMNINISSLNVFKSENNLVNESMLRELVQPVQDHTHDSANRESLTSSVSLLCAGTSQDHIEKVAKGPFSLTQVYRQRSGNVQTASCSFSDARKAHMSVSDPASMDVRGDATSKYVSISDTGNRSVGDVVSSQNVSVSVSGNGYLEISRCESVPNLIAVGPNHAEKIMFCLDVNPDPFLNCDEGSESLTLRKLIGAVQSFIRFKMMMDRRHQIRISPFFNEYFIRPGEPYTNIIEVERDFVKWFGPVGEADDFRTILQIFINESTLLYKLSHKKLFMPGFVVRVIFIFTTSHLSLMFQKQFMHLVRQLQLLPYFFFDILFINDRQHTSQGTYDRLCEFANQRSYVFNVERKFKTVTECLLKLLAHPLQRPKQNQGVHTL